MKRRVYVAFAYRRRRNYRAWLAGGVGVLTFIVGLTLSWNVLLCLLVGGALGALTYAARF